MFTGIIEEKGTVRRLDLNGHSGRITIAAHRVLEDTKVGDSIAINGICLTVVNMSDDSFTADVMAETVRRSSLASCTPGTEVNLERAMAAGGRFGGHIVTGHIDGTGRIRSMHREENAVWITVEAGAPLLRFIVEKGSIAIDGVSLTVAAVDADTFSVSIIPHTGEETTLLRKKTGDVVNLETDIIGKYVNKLLQPYSGSAGSDPSVQKSSPGDDFSGRDSREDILTLDYLRENGF